MRIFLCVCFSAAVFIDSADGQRDPNTMCTGVKDFDRCVTAWDCDLEISQCFCKSESPYCRCNNYIDEFYIGKSCSQRWSTLSFALVATLPGVALALVIGVAVHLAHRFSKPSRSHGAGNELDSIAEQDLYPGAVFASDLTFTPPPPTPLQVGLPKVSSLPYSAPDSKFPAFHRPPQESSYRPPPQSPILSMPLGPGAQPYSYTGGGAQVLSNPYATRNLYEERSVSAELYNQPASPRVYEEQMMALPPTPSYGPPEYRSVLPRVQIGHSY